MSRKAWPQNGCAFFVCIVVIFLPVIVSGYSPHLYAECALNKDEIKMLDQVVIQKVIDGDSIKLSDGQQVRLIGLNTPEIKSGEPLALEAKQRLGQLLASGKAYLKKGEQQKDHYGRWLGHLFLESGQSVEVLMLEQGLGFLVAIPPNIAMTPCLKAARDSARAKKAGVWSLDAYQAVSSREVTERDTGFKRVRGILQSVTQSKKDWWLQLDGLVVLRIAPKDQSVFNMDALKAMQGKEIVASGWMIDRKGGSAEKKGYSPFMLLLTHPVHIEVL